MRTNTFSDYALNTALSTDATYTVELMIEQVRDRFDPNYWDGWTERNDARESFEYKPHVSEKYVKVAEEEFKVLTWLSFQRIRDEKRPIRDLAALRFVPSLTDIVLSNNDISDISPIGSCTNLKSLDLHKNQISDISVLASCKKLEELSLGDNPINDFSVLYTLPNLKELYITADQIPVFKQLSKLENLKKLNFGSDTFESFEGFPELPELRVIRKANVRSLDGLQRFTKLENLVDLSGKFTTLDPLSNSKALTHVSILNSCIQSLDPLSGLISLRSLWVDTDASSLELYPLESLPALHEITVECNGSELVGLENFRATLDPWDIEFSVVDPRYTPSLELVIVDQIAFDVYDTQKPYNLANYDVNEGMLSSELEWLDSQINEVMSVEFEEDEDYALPSQWEAARSRTLILSSQEVIEAFPRLVLGIQKVLSTVKMDWIIYLQSEDNECVTWIYPDRILVTKEHVKYVQNLIKPN